MQKENKQLKSDLKAYGEGWNARQRILERFSPKIDSYIFELSQLYSFKIKRKEMQKEILSKIKNYVIESEDKIKYNRNLEKDIQKIITNTVYDKFFLLALYKDVFGIDPSDFSKGAEEKINKCAETCLTDKEYFVFKNRFPKPTATLTEIGSSYGLKRERIRQIEKKAIGKIQDMLKREAKKEVKKPSHFKEELVKYLKPYVKNFLEIKDISNEPFKNGSTTYVRDLELSVRTLNCLRYARIETLEQLALKTEMEMLAYPNFGRKSLAELRDVLQKYNLSFGMDPEGILLKKHCLSEIVNSIKKSELLDKKLDKFNITESLKNHLKKNKIYTLADLAKLTEAEFKSTDAETEHCEEAKELLESFGLGFGLKIKKYYFIE